MHSPIDGLRSCIQFRRCRSALRGLGNVAVIGDHLCNRVIGSRAGKNRNGFLFQEKYETETLRGSG